MQRQSQSQHSTPAPGRQWPYAQPEMDDEEPVPMIDENVPAANEPLVNARDERQDAPMAFAETPFSSSANAAATDGATPPDVVIAAEAYRIAEQQGFPLNSALDHWLEAERRLADRGSESQRF